MTKNHEPFEPLEPARPFPIALRILLLEDNPHDAELCILELKKAGFQIEVDPVDTEKAYTDRLASQTYDLILSDYRIPNWTGVEAFRVLKESGKDIPFILVTGTLGEEAAVDLIKNGVSDYILKDRLVRLPSAIVRTLDERALRQERERTTQALRDSEAQVRLLLDSTAEAIFGMDVRGNCSFCNAATVRMLGYDTAAELLGKQIHWLAHHTQPDGTPYPLEDCPIYKALQRGESCHVDTELLWRKDGSSFPAEYWSFPVQRDGKLMGSVVTFLDVSERKHAEQVLRRSEVRIRRLVESSIIGISIGDLTGKVLDANDAFLKLLGFTRTDLSSGSITWDTLTPPEFRESDRKALEQLKRSGFDKPREKQFFRKDGTRIAVLIGVTTLVNVEDEVEVISFVVDFSERKNLEEQLRQAQKMEAIGQLAGGIAHDFNNLLGVIVGYSEILLDQLEPGGQLHTDAEQIKRAADRAASLTRQLLAFSRKQVLQPVILDLNAVLADTEKLLRRLIGEDIELLVSPGKDLGRVKVDPGQIEQIVMNLAVNARDAMPKGGKLTIETLNVEMDEQFARQHAPARPGQYVMLAISDTGCGMDAETQAHIFDPFFTTKELGKGTGLGLSTVYGVVKQSGGFIWVYSGPGRGATFKIYLPSTDEFAAVDRPNEKGSETQGGSEIILVVEDDTELRALTERSLAEFGYTILGAKNPAEAIKMSERYQGTIHLMVTDVVMPGMSGRALAERMAELRPEMKVLYVSGYTDDAIFHHGMLEPELSFLQKPFSPKTLARHVRALLDSAQHRPEISVVTQPRSSKT